jgi:hypothetical protein
MNALRSRAESQHRLRAAGDRVRVARWHAGCFPFSGHAVERSAAMIVRRIWKAIVVLTLGVLGCHPPPDTGDGGDGGSGDGGKSCSIDSECQDEDMCNGAETCASGVCAAGTPMSCDDGLACTTDSCAPSTGACNHTPDNNVYGSDLSVQYISRLPRFPKSDVLYSPDAYNPRLSDQSAAAKQWPDPGDTVTFVAHVANQGEMATPAVQYRFLVDGVPVGSGLVATLNPGASADASLDWTWKDQAHIVRFELVGCTAFSDPHPANNAREQFTNAIMLTTYTWPGFETWMATHDNAVGTRSAADWIQYEADEMNRLFSISVSQIVPTGVLSRIAIDRVVSVPEQTPYGGGHIPPVACPTDGCWSFGGPNQGLQGWLTDVNGQRDQVTMHEWGHQIGLMDLYQMDIQENEVLVTEDPKVRMYSNSSAGSNIDKLFDGVLTVPIATYESRPVWFALVFALSRELTQVRMRFDGYVHQWQLFSADTLDDAITRMSPAVARTDKIITTDTNWGDVSFAPASAKVWLMYVDRLDADRMTHVNEWEVYDGSWKVDVLDLTQAKRVAGTPQMPLIYADVVRYNSIGYNMDLMSGGIPYVLSPYHQWALNTDADWMGRGLPLRRGWFGRYLFKIPTQNTLIVTNNGAPLANAIIDVYQQQDGTIPNVVKFTGKTDQSGKFVLPSKTTLEYATSYGLSAPLVVANPFSTVYSDLPSVIGTNGVLLFRVTDDCGDRAYSFTDLAQFGLEYARGHINDATYPVDLNFP